MSGFNLAGIIAGLNNTVDAIQGLTPLVTALGVPPGLATTVNNMVDAAQDTAKNVQSAMDDGKVIFTSNDQEQLKSLLERLEAEAEALDAYVIADTGGDE